MSPKQLANLPEADQRELLALLEEDQRDAIDKACAERVISHKRGPMYWLRNWTKTENYQWQAQGLEPQAPFPYRPHTGKIDLKALPFEHELSEDDPPDYLDIVAGYWLNEKELWVPKTREMLTSWLMCGLITWHCQFFEQIEWIGQSEDDEKAKGLVAYANILYRNQPDWMRNRHPLERGVEGTLHRIEWAHGSRFIGLPSGERKMASKHPWGYFQDESAHQPAGLATLDFAKPACKQVVCVSSVAPGGWWDLVNAAQ